MSKLEDMTDEQLISMTTEGIMMRQHAWLERARRKATSDFLEALREIAEERFKAGIKLRRRI
jgi:hypothetical protein